MSANGEHPPQPRVVVLGDPSTPESRRLDAHRQICPLCHKRSGEPKQARRLVHEQRAFQLVTDEHLMVCRLCLGLTQSDRPFAHCRKLERLVRQWLDRVGALYCNRGRALLRESAQANGLIAAPSPPEEAESA